MTAHQRAALDRLYRDATLHGLTPEELRSGVAELMGRFPIPDDITAADTGTAAGRPALRITTTAMRPISLIGSSADDIAALRSRTDVSMQPTLAALHRRFGHPRDTPRPSLADAHPCTTVRLRSRRTIVNECRTP